jgi:L-ascorbate metabolism protein UlaG (beta-lactamase superfamily)
MPPRESVTYLGHATVRLDLAGVRLLTDPILRDRLAHLRRRSRPLLPEEYEPLDGVLVSHLHLDHLDMPSIRRLERTVPVVVPRGGGAILRRIGFKDVREVAAGESVRVAGVEVLAVPAAHDPRRRPGGVAAEPIGYVATGAARVYFAGDTDVFDGMSELGALDLALLPVWGWGPTLGTGHMDPEAAAKALLLLRPRAAVPIHWGTLFPIGLGYAGSDRLTEPPREFARHAARLAPGVKVTILEPGTTLELDATPGPAASSAAP